ncbi:MAG: alpha/beta fold hydrolase [Gammaproteobacteria bacterium]|nr:alpha/beta fold hydrolase [Gammaproteobacteria bacterium]MDP7270459.1 alpha/beta fold hydrolase [Gammaproteobacteria bacterium]HJP05274.1 alpha/beta fold hydrolase [Gammaproteobacteria bacterium]
MARAPDKENLTIPGPAGLLEALLETPPDWASGCVAVLCHPHPRQGGMMHNKVVHTMVRAMHDLGLASLRFNFRGVGASEGKYADGEGEIGDVEAVAEYIRQRWPEAKLWLAGFSFGAVVSARAAQQAQPARLISIAPAVNILGRELAEQLSIPWLVIQGDGDEVVPHRDVVEWVNQIQPKPRLIVLKGAGHFFHGHLVELRETLVATLSE